MDELEKRRQLNASKIAHLTEVNQGKVDDLSSSEIENFKLDYKFEKQLEDAFTIEVPEGLESRILLEQSVNKTSHYLLKSALSIAASIVLLAFIFIGMQTNKLTEVALAHIYHELDHLVDSGLDISPQKVMEDIQALGFTLQSLPQNITYAGKCNIGNKQGMHIIAQVNSRPVTLLLSSEKTNSTSTFSDQRFIGKIFPTSAGSIIVVGESSLDIEAVFQQTGAI